MEILSRRGRIAHLEVVLGALLEPALQAGAGVLRALAFVAVRQEQHQAAVALPFGLAAREELVADDLAAVGEVAKLGFPYDEGDRKSTRLNSSHTVISYAVFCLKKKNKTTKCTK